MLKEVHLHEVSVVAVPANPRAEVLAVKTFGDVKAFVRDNLADAEPSADLLNDLRDIDREPKAFLSAHDPLLRDRAEAVAALKAFAADIQRYAV